MRSRRFPLGAVLSLAFLLGPAAQATAATIYGVKSCGASSAVDGHTITCANVISTTPTHLFTFEDDGTGFSDLGAIRLSGVEIDVDALAISPAHGLLGFRISSGSTLVSIDPITAVATLVGSAPTLARDLRGAVFQFDKLWVIDAIADSVLRIDPTTGAVVAGSEISLTLGGNPFNVSTASDIAIRQDGTPYLVSLSKIFTLNLASGALTEVRDDASFALAGATFAAGAGLDDLFAYEINDDDEIFRYDTDVVGIPKTVLFPDIIPSFNAGRGDLAAVIPEPSTAFLLGLGLLGLAAHGRRRKA